MTLEQAVLKLFIIWRHSLIQPHFVWTSNIYLYIWLYFIKVNRLTFYCDWLGFYTKIPVFSPIPFTAVLYVYRRRRVMMMMMMMEVRRNSKMFILFQSTFSVTKKVLVIWWKMLNSVQFSFGFTPQLTDEYCHRTDVCSSALLLPDLISASVVVKEKGEACSPWLFCCPWKLVGSKY